MGEIRPAEPNLVRCSFCGKTQKQVKKLVAGPSVYICDECVGLCNWILIEEEQHDSIDRSAESVSLPRDDLTSVVRILDQAARAIGPTDAVADEATHLAERLNWRLHAPPDPNPGDGDDGVDTPDVGGQPDA